MSDELLPQAVLRGIGDKLYDRRKAAALEVEQVVKRLAAAHDHARIRLLVDKLVTDYASSYQANSRKGALLCLAAATVGLGEPNAQQLQIIVPSVLRSFTDPDSRVRYYACEALYNIAKVARQAFLPYFNEVFDAMFRLCADSDSNVMNAVTFLDNLIKDIVSAFPCQVNLATFIPKVHDYLPVMSAPKRVFLISWIQVLNSIPDVDLLRYLPQLLAGLLHILADPTREVRAQVATLLQEFLCEAQANRGSVDFVTLTHTLIEQAHSHDEATRLACIKWMQSFVQLAPRQLAGLYPAILSVALTNMSHFESQMAEAARATSDALLANAPVEAAGVPGRPNQPPLVPFDTEAILATISAQLLGGAHEGGPGAASEASRLEALRWVEFLLGCAHHQVLGALPALLPALLDALTSQSEAVAKGSLGVFVAIARCPGQFRPALAALLDRFRGDAGAALLQRGGALVVRRLCGALGAQPVFVELAGALHEERDLVFAAGMVQALNLVLVTAPEARHLREALHTAGQCVQPSVQDSPGKLNGANGVGKGSAQQGTALFGALHPAWSHAPGSLLCLCFLACAYDHAYDIVHCYTHLPMGAELLVQLDRLVQLLDAPAFAGLRLALLQPRRAAPLLRALFGVLQLLPQSNAFCSLSTRLQSAPTQALLEEREPRSLAIAAAAVAAAQQLRPGSVGAGGALLAVAPLDLDDLLLQFCTRQLQQYAVEIGEMGGQLVAPTFGPLSGSATSAARGHPSVRPTSAIAPTPPAPASVSKPNNTHGPAANTSNTAPQSPTLVASLTSITATATTVKPVAAEPSTVPLPTIPPPPAPSRTQSLAPNTGITASQPISTGHGHSRSVSNLISASPSGGSVSKAPTSLGSSTSLAGVQSGTSLAGVPSVLGQGGRYSGVGPMATMGTPAASVKSADEAEMDTLPPPAVPEDY